MKKIVSATFFTAFLVMVSSSFAVHFDPPDRKVNSNAAGTSYTGGFFTCDNNGNVYAFYNDSRNTAHPEREDYAFQVFFNSSTDHGVTWATDTVIGSRATFEDYTATVHLWTPFLGCNESGHFYCGWQDGKDFNNESRPNHGTGWWEDGFCTRTLDTGSTWTADTRINTWNGNYPRCAQPMSANDQNGNIYVVWYSTIEQPTNYNVICFNRSTDYGVTWKTETRLDHAAAVASEWYPSIKCDESGHVFAVWQASGRKQIRFGDYKRSGTRL